MTKEEALESIKSSVLALIEREDRFQREHPDEYNSIKQRIIKGKTCMKELNSCDMLWISEEYNKWLQTDPNVQRKIEEYKELM